MTGGPVEAGQVDGLCYVGLATRVISFVLDAALISVVAITVGVGAALIQGVLHLPSNLQTIIQLVGAAAYIVGTAAYFVGFWTATGQTPGARVMRIRVVTARGEALSSRRALVRFVGVVLAGLPLFAGFVPILFDARRRGFQDRLARTLVVEAPEPSIAQSLRLKQRAANGELRPRSGGQARDRHPDEACGTIAPAERALIDHRARTGPVHLPLQPHGRTLEEAPTAAHASLRVSWLALIMSSFDLPE